MHSLGVRVVGMLLSAAAMSAVVVWLIHETPGSPTTVYIFFVPIGSNVPEPWDLPLSGLGICFAVPAVAMVVRGHRRSRIVIRVAIALTWGLSFGVWSALVVHGVAVLLDLTEGVWTAVGWDSTALWFIGVVVVAGGMTSVLMAFLTGSRFIGAGLGTATLAAAAWYALEESLDRWPPVVWQGLVSATVAWYVLRLPPRPGFCVTCGYSFEGLAAGTVCPECGAHRPAPTGLAGAGS